MEKRGLIALQTLMLFELIAGIIVFVSLVYGGNMLMLARYGEFNKFYLRGDIILMLESVYASVNEVDVKLDLGREVRVNDNKIFVGGVEVEYDSMRVSVFEEEDALRFVRKVDSGVVR